MNFKRNNASNDEPEINLIPMIDVLLVIIIFLMLTTTYSRFADLNINLPTAENNPSQSILEPKELEVIITADGEIKIGDSLLSAQASNDEILNLLETQKNNLNKNKADENLLLIISADAKTPHQRVIDIMQLSQKIGIEKISFSIEELRK
ncbi:MAG: ExbD/TolR family protein [Rhodocyclaceae bacterium]